MKTLFAPGCALRVYKPELVDDLTKFLSENNIIDGTYDICCKSDWTIEEDVQIIDCCPGCSHQFSSRSNVHVISLWKVLLNTDFPLPNYQGKEMTIHDACHARNRNSSEMQDSVRRLCEKMNISLIEPSLTKDKTPCCGGCSKNIEVRKQMAVKREESLPNKDVVLYCTGCVRSFSETPVQPYHILDLIFNEVTEGLTIKS